jgi:very-short-patch-repair endonuclease
MASKLEDDFDYLWAKKCTSKLVKELQFAKNLGRKWKFDFANVDAQVAIEIEGGVWISGRHTRGKGFIKDCEKYNTATLMGWSVFRLPGLVVKDLQDIDNFIKHRLNEGWKRIWRVLKKQ